MCDPLTTNELLKFQEDQVMAHRYLYYVLASPVYPDAVYDIIERDARAVLPADSPVQGVGSSLPSSYTKEQVELALSWLPKEN